MVTTQAPLGVSKLKAGEPSLDVDDSRWHWCQQDIIILFQNWDLSLIAQWPKLQFALVKVVLNS